MQYQRRFLVDSITRENLAQFMRDRGPKNLLFQATPVQKKRRRLNSSPTSLTIFVYLFPIEKGCFG
jgi:hypothetical protein